MGTLCFVYQLSVQKHWTSACIHYLLVHDFYMSLLLQPLDPVLINKNYSKTAVCSVCAKIRMSCTYAKEHSGVEEFWWDIIHKIIPPKEEDI